MTGLFERKRVNFQWHFLKYVLSTNLQIISNYLRFLITTTKFHVPFWIGFPLYKRLVILSVAFNSKLNKKTKVIFISSFIIHILLSDCAAKSGKKSLLCVNENTVYLVLVKKYIGYPKCIGQFGHERSNKCDFL